ncbi:unnamed protein product [Tilletia controversa]|nr:unnamed protein product [Tilletia controversa]
MALQPLLDALAHLQVGIIVPGLGRIGSLAFADDVTLLLPLGPEGLQQSSQVLHALSLYESASGARLNRAKSGYFVVSKGPTRTDPLLQALQALQAWGLRPLTPANGELPHLGHPLQLGTPGTPCPISFADRLAAIGTRIELMETSDTDLLLRVRLCNSLLTPMLWHHTAVGGLPLNAGKLTRLAQTPSAPCPVNWHVGQDTPTASWAVAWKELHAVPLPSNAITSCYLWMHRRAWLARTGATVAPCPLCDTTESETQEHAYVTCPSIKNVWHTALPLLRALGVGDILSHNALDTVLGWQQVREHRHRLILWRTAIVHWIASVRSPALSRRITTSSFSLALPSHSSIASSITTLVAEGIQSDWTRIRQRPTLTPGQASRLFDDRWATSSSFVRRVTDSDTAITFTIPSTL